MDCTGRVLIYLREECGDDGVCYVKGRDIGEAAGLKSRQAAITLLDLGRCEDVPVDVEKWSSTAGSTTYRVVVTDETALGAGGVEDVAARVA